MSEATDTITAEAASAVRQQAEQEKRAAFERELDALLDRYGYTFTVHQQVLVVPRQ